MTDTSTNGVKARHSSETVEYFTPIAIIEAARVVLGGFDLDPFSCAKANDAVRATRYFGGGTPFDGWVEPWEGRCLVNPPGGRGPKNVSNQKRAWERLESEYAAGRVTAAIFICFSVELLQTSQVKSTGKTPLDFPFAWPSRRLQYRDADGNKTKSPPHSSCIILLPQHPDHPKCEACGIDTLGCLRCPRCGGNLKSMTKLFKETYAQFGRVVVPT